jgi:hypothetical protein
VHGSTFEDGDTHREPAPDEEFDAASVFAKLKTLKSDKTDE